MFQTFVILFFIHILSCTYVYNVQQDSDSKVLRQGHRIYFIKDGTKHRFPDTYTIKKMGYDYHNVPILGKKSLDHIPTGALLPSLWDHHSNIKMLSLGISKYILNAHKLLHVTNGDFVYFKNKIIVSWRITGLEFRITALNIPNKVSIRTDLSIEEDFRILQDIKFNETQKFHEMIGEDPRLFVLNEGSNHQKIFVIFSRRNLKPHDSPELQMAYCELQITSDDVISCDPIIDFDIQRIRGIQDQKNWSPFQYNESLYFTAESTPQHFVVDLNSQVISEGVNQDTSIYNIWKHGTIRGGTPAIRLNETMYLAIFHSSNIPYVVGDVLKTYAMGAYLFDAKPPFRIRAITRKPMIHQSMYSGSWAYLPDSYYHIDYVVFPMGLLKSWHYYNPLDETSRFVYLIYGKQDVETWVAKIEVEKLLYDMISII